MFFLFFNHYGFDERRLILLSYMNKHDNIYAQFDFIRSLLNVFYCN